MFKKKRKWTRVHFFKRKKSTPNRVGHPVYVYGSSGKNYKYLVFTHTPKNDDFVELKHNIDPFEDGVKKSYVKKDFEVSDKSSLRDPDKKYRIHSDDMNTIKRLKK